MDEQPTLQQPGGKSKGMPLLALIAGVLVISYTVWRLQYAANNLPYDPGPPLPAIDVTATTAEELSVAMREAFLSRHSARTLKARGDGTPDPTAPPKLYGAWQLRGLELERAIRYVDKMIAGLRNAPLDSRDSDSCQRLATLVATRKLIDQDRVFATDGAVMPLKETPRWHVWNLMLFQKKKRQRWLYAVISTAEFGFVRDAGTADPATFDPR